MKKILLIVLACCVSFYVASLILHLISLPDKVEMYISLIFLVLPIVIYFGVINLIIKKQNDNVSKCSEKIQQLTKLNEEYKFKKIKHKMHIIKEREYSRKSLDRVTGSSIVKYHLENDIDFLRTDIENAIYNINLLDDYNNDVNKIINKDSINNTKYSDKKFRKIENRVCNNIIHKKKEFIIKLKLEVYYKSNGGNVFDNRYGSGSFEQLVNCYNEWKKGNRYEETKKQERKIMNDDIRYNVLKRDNYTCQICGATVKDGVKLHVDHIIPVAKGGKTVMSNLQTLCERCNMGKSDKTDDDNDMICPKCGSKLVRRNGKYGSFIGCSGYPRCNYTRK